MITTRLVAKLAIPTVMMLLSCGPDAVDRLVQHAPGLDREIASHLVHDDDSTLVRFLRETGWPRTYFAQQRLLPGDYRSLAAFRMAEAPVLAAQMRMAKAIGPAFDLRQHSDSIAARLSGPIGYRYELRRRSDLILKTPRTTSLSLAERAQRIDDLERGWDACSALAFVARADLAAERGDVEGRIRNMRRALAGARAAGNVYLVCWHSGSLSESYLQTGERDSAVRILEDGLALAQRHRMIDQMARFHLFLANLYANEGRWALAGDHLGEVRRLAREPGMKGEDIRYLAESMEFPIRMGWWDWVERDLRGAGASIRRARRAGSPWSEGLEPALTEAQALVFAHAGDMESADRLFREADAALRKPGGRVPRRGRLLARWSQCLMDAGRWREAATAARVGLAYCDSMKIGEHQTTNALALARACVMSGDLAGAEQALAGFERAVALHGQPRLAETIDYEAVRARFHRARHDRSAMLSALRSGLARLEAGVAAMDATPEAYTFLYRQNDLHDLTLELVPDPDVSLEIERRWRRAASLLRGHGSSGELTSCADLVEFGPTTRPRPAPASAALGGDVSLTYHIGATVIRWSRDGAGTRRDEIRVSPHDLERRVGRAMEMMSTDPGRADAGVDGALQSSLRDLATLLLPPGLATTHGAASGRWLRIQTDGALGSFPFEALNLSDDRYSPLLAHWGVVYVRGVATPGRRARIGTILADPLFASRLKQMHGGLASLPGGRMEAQRMAAVDPSARQLIGKDATRRALEKVWTDSRYLFLATHAASEPNDVSSFFIPLASDPLDPRRDSEYLEVADVLAADFSRCELVVLSGCATGVPVALASSGAPSLASAFVDAGASAVIRTSWPIRDDAAAATMSTFIELWKHRGMTPEAALDEARRRSLLANIGYRHPFTWAAYGIELVEMPDAGSFAARGS